MIKASGYGKAKGSLITKTILAQRIANIAALTEPEVDSTTANAT